MRIEITPEYLQAQGLSETFPERFWSKVNKDGPIPQHRPELGKCWVWTAMVTDRGYGTMAARYKGDYRTAMIRAHKASWVLHFGPVPEGMEVCHHCDNSICIRPDHLWIGTHDENMKDMVQKGRAKGNPGESHGMAKLNDDAVRRIRFLIEAGEMNGTEIGRLFGVSKYTVSLIHRGKVWTHVH